MRQSLTCISENDGNPIALQERACTETYIVKNDKHVGRQRTSEKEDAEVQQPEAYASRLFHTTPRPWNPILTEPNAGLEMTHTVSVARWRQSDIAHAPIRLRALAAQRTHAEERVIVMIPMAHILILRLTWDRAKMLGQKLLF